MKEPPVGVEQERRHRVANAGRNVRYFVLHEGRKDHRRSGLARHPQFVIAAPEMVASAAMDLASIGSTISEANAAAVAPTTGVMVAAGDEVSAAVASPRNPWHWAGVGLAIVRLVMDKHGGVVTAESAPDCGSTFSLVFPQGGAS